MNSQPPCKGPLVAAERAAPAKVQRPLSGWGLVRGGGGIFVVSVNEKSIFSKKEEGRFPTESEIVDKLRAMQ